MSRAAIPIARNPTVGAAGGRKRGLPRRFWSTSSTPSWLTPGIRGTGGPTLCPCRSRSARILRDTPSCGCSVKRQDALKVLSAELTADQQFRARLLREADVAAGLIAATVMPAGRRSAATVGLDRPHTTGLWARMDGIEALRTWAQLGRPHRTERWLWLGGRVSGIHHRRHNRRGERDYRQGRTAPMAAKPNAVAATAERFRQIRAARALRRPQARVPPRR
jgi:hypothetical protein